MPKFLVDKLKAEYPDNPSVVYGTLNTIGAMNGPNETAKGAAMQAKHDATVKAPAAPKATPMAAKPKTGGAHPLKNLGAFAHVPKSRKGK